MWRSALTGLMIALLALPVTVTAREIKTPPKPGQTLAEARLDQPVIRIPIPRGVPKARGGLDVRAEYNLTGESGWLAVDLRTGRVIDAYLPDRAFAPASVAKLPTAFFALDRLGPTYRFETHVAVTGAVQNERLEGNLVLVGGGDPELDTDALLPLVTDTKKLGFRQVSGAFLVDASAAPSQASIDPDQPAEAPYNPGLSGLNLNYNRVRLKWDPKRAAHGIEVLAWARRLHPPASAVRVIPAAAGRLFDHSFDDAGEVWQMSQRALRRRGERWLPVKAPAIYTAEVFRSLARTYGIALDAPQRAEVAGARIVATHQSRPLSRILRDMLKYSTNITAEAVGAAASQSESTEASAADMNAWAARLGGFAPGDPGFALVNHSGLTTKSRVSPRRLVALLQGLSQRPGGTHARLPGVAAGYLKPHNVAADKVPIAFDALDVVSKTGTMNFIRGLAGYVATPGGQQIAFAIFSNDLSRRGFDDRGTKRWMARARGFERALIRNWVLKVDGKS